MTAAGIGAALAGIQGARCPERRRRLAGRTVIPPSSMQGPGPQSRGGERPRERAEETTMSEFEVTAAHQAIFDAVRDPDGGNLIVSAVAGSGKTTTVVEAMRLTTGRVAYLVFGRRNADEAQAKVPVHVVACTLNALGHRALGAVLKGRGVEIKVDEDKVRKLVRDRGFAREQDFYALGAVTTRLVRLAKTSGIVPAGFGTEPSLLPDEPQTWLDLIDHHGLDVPDGAQPIDVVAAARKVLRASCEDLSTIDYDDQLLLAYALRAPVPAHDWVFADEAQDLSPLQHALIRRALGERGRLVAVGDERQAIYGFRGADCESMVTLAREFGCRSFPLHVSYRCPRAVVAVARRYVGHIEPHPDAPDGTVDESGKPSDQVGMAPGDLVVSRKTSGAVRVAYGLLRVGTPAVILGRDVGAGLVALARKIGGTSVGEFEERLTAWEVREVEKARRRDDEAKMASIADTAETLRVFAEGVERIEDLAVRIEAVFADGADAASVVTCCTIHKAKGLEAERVWVVDAHALPAKWARLPWQQQQEVNLAYVAVTRAKSYLGFVTPPSSVPIPATRTGEAEPWVVVPGRTYDAREALREQCGARFCVDASGNPLPRGTEKLWRVPASRLEHARAIVEGTNPDREYDRRGSGRRGYRARAW